MRNPKIPVLVISYERLNGVVTKHSFDGDAHLARVFVEGSPMHGTRTIAVYQGKEMLDVWDGQRWSSEIAEALFAEETGDERRTCHED